MGQVSVTCKERARMNQKAFDYAKPFDRLVVAGDVLPSPGDLVSREDTVKVTISLSKESVDFFKLEAKKHGTQYQKMIRKLLDLYVRHYNQNESPGY